MPDQAQIDLYKEDSEDELSPEFQTAFINIMKYCEQEDSEVRLRHLYEAKQSDLYWHGFQNIYWDYNAEEFRIPTHEQLRDVGATREEAEYVYNYVTNIFKAHGLSIIAAMGADIPGVTFYPDNPEDADSIRAARKAEQLAQIIHRTNNSKLILLQALFTLFTQHLVACNIYYETDEKYGQARVPKFKLVAEDSPATYQCSGCSYLTDLPIDFCPDCSAPTNKIDGEERVTPQPDGHSLIDKGFPNFGIYGVLNVRVPSYAITQKDCGYLFLYTDKPVSRLRDTYPQIREKITTGLFGDTTERDARSPSVSSPFSTDTYSNNLATEKKMWLRPWQFECLDNIDKDEKDAGVVDRLKKEYPSGVCVTFIGDDLIAEAYPANMDEDWEITKGDLSRTIHGDSLGKSLIPIQDIRNTMSNLMLECVEHSIPTNFATPDILDFTKYSSQEIKPGLVYPTKKRNNPQSNIADHFHSFKTATLPKEALDLQSNIDKDGQFVSGSLPAIFGGEGGGSKTLGEYQESRQYALGRLSIPNLLVHYWWGNSTFKAVNLYIKKMLEDDRYTLPDRDGRFESVWIRRDDFKGKFNLLIPETAGDLPVTYSQKRQMIWSAIQLNSEPVNTFLFSPENMRVTLRYVAFQELTAPEEVQVLKTLRVISQLLQETPQINEMDGEVLITIHPEQDVDDPEIQKRILKNFLCTDSGQDQKQQNPEGYSACLQYMKELKILEEMQMMEEATKNSMVAPQNPTSQNQEVEAS